MTMPNHPDPQIQQPAPQYPMQPAGGFAPPEPKKRKKWPWIVGAFVALFVVTSVAGGGNEDEPTATASRGADSGNAAPLAESPAADSGNAAPPVEPPAAEESSATMNMPVRDGKFEFVVTGVEAGLTSLGDNPFLAEDAQGQFVIVTMTVSNIADEPKGLSPSNQKLIDAQGRSFSPDTAAALNLDSDVTFWDEINPGNTVTMPLVFDMPVDAVPSAIELHDSMFSGGVTVSLR
ncbi:DUF4352 domain-containing protein [Rhodococcus coprophilus]|uniref:Telomeric repeat-binding factor 2 n=1 Tax=Rhodococcus coprophilus TaxID=38310 RepID=A0A2X4TUY1_9NOCA|nr:DUF4352 domain-containing protein [Rhodococcus coprophilus]MBM7458150.1 hypothetical protein [Rhodococcus coprophilus]SQI31206.1 Telomeric repeat-binding factor 2 [Rhodococcus coprophilus]